MGGKEYRHTGLASLLSLRVVEVSNWAMRSSMDGAFSMGLRVGDELRVKPFEESCARGDEEEAEVVVVVVDACTEDVNSPFSMVGAT